MISALLVEVLELFAAVSDVMGGVGGAGGARRGCGAPPAPIAALGAPRPPPRAALVLVLHVVLMSRLLPAACMPALATYYSSRIPTGSAGIFGYLLDLQCHVLYPYIYMHQYEPIRE